MIERPAWLHPVRRARWKMLGSDGAGPHDGQVIHLDYPVHPSRASATTGPLHLVGDLPTASPSGPAKQ